MSFIGMTEVAAAVIVAAGTDRLPESSVWRLNEMLLQVDREAASSGRLRAWSRVRRDVVGYCPAVVGASPSDEGRTVDHVIRHLLGDGNLVREGTGLVADLVVTDALSRLGRAVLFQASPEDAAVLYRAGRRFASCLSTSAKKRASARSSGTARSGTPLMRLQPVPGL